MNVIPSNALRVTAAGMLPLLAFYGEWQTP